VEKLWRNVSLSAWLAKESQIASFCGKRIFSVGNPFYVLGTPWLVIHRGVENPLLEISEKLPGVNNPVPHPLAAALGSSTGHASLFENRSLTLQKIGSEKS